MPRRPCSSRPSAITPPPIPVLTVMKTMVPRAALPRRTAIRRARRHWRRSPAAPPARGVPAARRRAARRASRPASAPRRTMPALGLERARRPRCRAATGGVPAPAATRRADGDLADHRAPGRRGRRSPTAARPASSPSASTSAARSWVPPRSIAERVPRHAMSAAPAGRAARPCGRQGRARRRRASPAPPSRPRRRAAAARCARGCRHRRAAAPRLPRPPSRIRPRALEQARAGGVRQALPLHADRGAEQRHEADPVEPGRELRHRRLQPQHDPGRRAELGDEVERLGHDRTVLGMDGDEVRARLGELADLLEHDVVLHHEVDMDRPLRQGADARDQVGEEQEGRGEVAIRHIDVVMSACGIGPREIRLQVAEVGRPQRELANEPVGRQGRDQRLRRGGVGRVRHAGSSCGRRSRKAAMAARTSSVCSPLSVAFGVTRTSWAPGMRVASASATPSGWT